MPSDWEYLSRIPLFSTLSERRLRKLARGAIEDSYERKLVLDDPSMAWELLKTLARRVRDA
jgi:hypothetical protein